MMAMERGRGWVGYAWAAAAAFACTVAGFALQPRFDLVNIAMVYVLAVVLVARYFSRGPAILVTVLGVLAFDVLFVPPQGLLMVHDAQYLLTFAIMLVIGLIVSGLVEGVRRQARSQAGLEMEAETERLRSVLLASISHDMRTPLAVIAGASSSLVEAGDRLETDQRQALARSVFERSREMSEHIEKILQMTQLESGAIKPERDWAALGEICGSVLARLESRLAAHRLRLDLPADLPLVRVDAALIERALGNLLENAALHTPPGTTVRLSARRDGAEIVVTVADDARRAQPVDVGGILESRPRDTGGNVASRRGLGIAICRAIIRLHEGRLWAEPAPEGGLAVRFALRAEDLPGLPEELAGA